MTKWGAIPSGDTLYHETQLSLGITQTLITNAVGTYTLGTYTMPMTGSLTANIEMGWSFTDNVQDFVAQLEVASTPAPAQGFGIHRTANGLGTTAEFVVGQMLYYWPSVTAGTLVTVKATCTNGPYAPTVTVVWANGTLRSCRT